MSNMSKHQKLLLALAVTALFPSLFFGLKNVSAAALPDQTLTPTVAPENSVTVTPTPDPGLSGTPTPTAAADISATVTPTGEPSVTPTVTPEITVTDTPVPTEEPVETPTDTPVPTDTPIPTASPTPFSKDIVFEAETIRFDYYESDSRYVELFWNQEELPEDARDKLIEYVEQPVYMTVFDYDTFSYKQVISAYSSYPVYHERPAAEGYVIYKVDAAGNEKAVARTAADVYSVKIKGLSPATRYRFAVRAMRRSDDGTKNVYTQAAYINTVTCPNAPKMKSLKISEKSASISWGSTKCEGYELISLQHYDYFGDGGNVITSVKSGKTSVNLKRTRFKGLNPNYDPVKRIAKIGVRAFATDADGNRRYSKVSSKKTTVNTYIPSIVELKEEFGDGIKKLNKIKRGKSNTGRYSVYNFKTGYSPKKRSSYKMSFTAADKREVKKFANKYFEKGWTPGEKVAFTLLWINMNNTYDRSYKYSGRHSVGEVIFKYRYGQCLQYNGALVEMMNYLGYDAYLVASLRSNKGSWQHYRAFIKYKGKEYSCETGTYSSNGAWRWLMAKGDQMAAN